MKYRYEIEPRAAELGGGWHLRLFCRDADGVDLEIGGGIYEPDCYQDALDTAEDWLSARER